MAENDADYFGVRLGDAIASGAGHIASGLQRRYEIKRQNELMAQERARQEEEKDKTQNIQLSMKGVSEGIPYDPSNPMASFGAWAEQNKKGRELDTRSKEADISYKTARTNTVINPKPKPTIAQTAVDRAFGKEYSNYVAGGGYADIFGQINSLKDIKNRLSSGKESLTGPIISLIPESIRARTNPASIAAQQEVENTIQRTLRATLGAQFTEREGVMFMQRGYDPRLSEKENANKLQRAISQLETMANAKQDAIKYYERNGSLSGYKGKLYNLRNGEIVPGTIPEVEAQIENPTGSYESIRVLNRATGETGTIPADEFNDSEYERI